MHVRVLGATVALLTGRAHIRGHVKGPGVKAQDFSGLYRFSDLWQRREAGWPVVAEHVVRVRNQ